MHHLISILVCSVIAVDVDMTNVHAVLKSASDMQSVSLAGVSDVALGESITDKQKEIDLYNYCKEGLKIEKQNQKKLFCIRCVNHTEKLNGRDVEQRRCVKCKYTTTNENKTCSFYRNESEYSQFSSNVANISFCEGVFRDSKLKKQSCFMCKEGYALKREKDSSIYECQKSTIKLCVVSEMLDGKEKCYVCSRGYPTPDFSSCRDESTLTNDNCYLGMRHESYNKANPFCALCEHNYALVDQNLSNTTEEKPATCQITAKQNQLVTDRCPFGCGRCNVLKECLWCNHYNGFYMTDIDTCTYTAVIANFRYLMLAAIGYLMLN